jgi:plastocyanin
VGRKRLLGASVVLAVALLGACGDDGGAGDTVGGTSSTSGDRAGEAAVTMRLIAYRPAQLTVDAGTTVTWTQQDAGTHTVTSGTVEPGAAGVTERPDGRFDSGPLATGKTFRFTFGDPGTYSYFCTVHPATMRGEVRAT